MVSGGSRQTVGRYVVAAVAMACALVAPQMASGQTLGTFVWQMAPYCNVLTLSVTVDGAAYRLTGFDNACGGTVRVPVAGAAVPNPNGTFTLTLTTATVAGPSSQLTAVVTAPSYNGAWADSSGNSGDFVFSPTSPVGAVRPLPLVSGAAIADGSIGGVDVNLAELQARVTGSCPAGQFLTLVNQDGTVACGTPLGGGDITAVTAGAGLTGGGTAGDVALAIGAGAVTGSMIANGAVSGAHLAVPISRNGSSSSSVIGVMNTGTGGGISATAGFSSLGSAAVFNSNNTGNPADVVRITSLGTGDLIQADWAITPGAYDTVFRVSWDGNVTADGTFIGGGADVAEFFESVDEVGPGDVVEIDPEVDGRFRRARSAFSTAVAGVVTTAPGLLMNADASAALSDGPALALAGRVPVKATDEGGAIRPGDLLVAASLPGHARRAPQHPEPGTVIGKALGRLDSGVGTVEMLVMLR